MPVYLRAFSDLGRPRPGIKKLCYVLAAIFMVSALLVSDDERVADWLWSVLFGWML